MLSSSAKNTHFSVVGTHGFVARDDRHHSGNVSPGDTAGGNLNGVNIIFEL